MGVVMVTGGARSGKSTFAEKLAAEVGGRVGYIATAVVTDDDMLERIARHRETRPKAWVTFESYSGFVALWDDPRFSACDTLLLDCLTTMTANHMVESGLDFDTCALEPVGEVERRVQAEVDALIDGVGQRTLIVVTNEVGQGVVPVYRMGSLFRDMAGRLNMHVAARADSVFCMISGLSLRLK